MKKNFKEIRLVNTCPFCGKSVSVWVNEVDYYDWQDGELAQNAFPYLTAEQREVLISGICPTCWDGMFGSADDEEDPDDDWGFNEDEGFDPYEGCYTGDC